MYCSALFLEVQPAKSSIFSLCQANSDLSSQSGLTALIHHPSRSIQQRTTVSII